MGITLAKVYTDSVLVESQRSVETFAEFVDEHNELPYADIVNKYIQTPKQKKPSRKHMTYADIVEDYVSTSPVEDTLRKLYWSDIEL